MQSAELSLGAALRDATAKRESARDKALSNLAMAMLAELSRPGPAWRAADDHPRGREVLDTFIAAIADKDAPASRRGMAAVGLGTIGEPSLLALVEDWLQAEGDAPDIMFLRECAIIGISFLGTAAPADAPEREQVLAQIRVTMDSPYPDVRFQAAMALVEVAGNDAEADLVAALRHEQHTTVRDNLVLAMGRLDPPGTATCEALEAILDGDEADSGLGFSAAMALADARRSVARPRLLEALVVRAHRDLALEALAALGGADSADCDQVLEIARRWWLPGVTRVRAAYALICMQGAEDEGEARAMLERFAWHPRPAVREAVTDARAALEKLGVNRAS
ncbi:MAG: HEAT repeat domain-containing protein [Nannocystaceae bacterium]|nr:HEAT repeat domain-containing protein [Nannocystaceae bacterium]